MEPAERPRWRRVLPLRGVVGVLLGLGVGGCRPAPEGVTLWHALGGPLGRTLEVLVDTFNHREGRSLQLVFMGNYATLSQKIMAAAVARQLPTAAQVYESWASELRDARRLVPVGDFLPDSLREDVFPAFLEANTWGDTLWTFPFNKSVPVLYYNRRLLDSLGVPPPRTWEAFRELAHRLTVDADGDGVPERWGTAFPVDVWLFTCILYQMGGQILDGDRVAVADSPGVRALGFLKGLLDDRVAYLASGYSHQDDFATGRVGMVFGTIVSYQFLKDKLTFPLGVAPLPQVDPEHPVTVMAGTNIALFTGYPDTAYGVIRDFLRFFLSPEVQVRWVLGSGYLPLRRSVMDHPDLQAFFEEVPGMREAMLQVEYAVTEPRDPVWFTARRYLSTEGLEPALRGALSVEEALQRAARMIQVELSRRRVLAQRTGAVRTGSP